MTLIFLVLIATRMVGNDAKDQSPLKSGPVAVQPVVAETLKVTAERVVPYVLLFDANLGHWRFIRAQKVGGDLATTGNGVIWADTGLWNFEILTVAGREVRGLTATEMTRLIFHDSKEVLLIELRSRSGRIVLAEAYTHRGGWLSKK